jgi:hypothetical protein
MNLDQMVLNSAKGQGVSSVNKSKLKRRKKTVI